MDRNFPWGSPDTGQSKTDFQTVLNTLQELRGKYGQTTKGNQENNAEQNINK